MDGALLAKAREEETGEREWKAQTGERVGKQGLDSRNIGPSASGGQSLVELALTLPVILLMLFGIIELGRAFLIYSEVSNAAREGARCGVVDPGNNALIEECARAKVAVVPADQITVTVSYDTEPAFGHRVIVTATHDLALLTPLIADFIGPLHIEMVSARTILGGE